MKHFGKTLAMLAFVIMALSQSAFTFGTPKAGDFVNKASVAGMFEVESSKLALDRSTNADVRAFAQQMIADHGAAGEGLKASAATAGFNGSVATSLDKKHQKMLDKLAKQDAKDFDLTYVNEQQKAHKEAVSLFKSYADKGDNATLKTFASNTVPTLEHHKEEANALDDKVKKAE